MEMQMQQRNMRFINLRFAQRQPEGHISVAPDGNNPRVQPKRIALKRGTGSRGVY